MLKHIELNKENGTPIINYCIITIDSKHMFKTQRERIEKNTIVEFNPVVIEIDGKIKKFKLGDFKQRLGFN